MIKKQICAIIAPTTVWHPPRMHKRLTLINLMVQIAQWFHLVNSFLAQSVVLCRVSGSHRCTGVSIQAESSAQRADHEPTLNTTSCSIPGVQKELLSLHFNLIQLSSGSSSRRLWSFLHQASKARKTLTCPHSTATAPRCMRPVPLLLLILFRIICVR